jgi:F420-non-reducing hydrogenase large subunit
VAKANLIVATQNNAARIAMSVDQAARTLIHKDVVSDGILNMVEMAFRADDPCHGRAMHALPGQMPLMVSVCTPEHELKYRVQRESDRAVASRSRNALAPPHRLAARRV